jgi:RNA-binding protein
VKRIGKVMHLSNSGKLVLKTQLDARVGLTVLDDELKRVGTVVDVFGPVNHPYTSVQPATRNPDKYVGKSLYVLDQS